MHAVRQTPSMIAADAARDARIFELESEVAHLRRQLALQLDADLADRLRAGLSLTMMQCRIVATLYERRGRAVSRAGLVAALYGDRDEPHSRTVDVHVLRIRRELGSDAIETVKERGFKLGPAAIQLCDLAAAGELPRKPGRRRWDGGVNEVLRFLVDAPATVAAIAHASGATEDQVQSVMHHCLTAKYLRRVASQRTPCGRVAIYALTPKGRARQIEGRTRETRDRSPGDRP